MSKHPKSSKGIPEELAGAVWTAAGSILGWSRVPVDAVEAWVSSDHAAKCVERDAERCAAEARRPARTGREQAVLALVVLGLGWLGSCLRPQPHRPAALWESLRRELALPPDLIALAESRRRGNEIVLADVRAFREVSERLHDLTQQGMPSFRLLIDAKTRAYAIDGHVLWISKGGPYPNYARPRNKPGSLLLALARNRRVRWEPWHSRWGPALRRATRGQLTIIHSGHYARLTGSLLPPPA